MGNYYVPSPSGITKLLQSAEMLELTERYARERAGVDGELKPFIGFDRAKTFVYNSGEGSKGQ